MLLPHKQVRRPRNIKEVTALLHGETACDARWRESNYSNPISLWENGGQPCGTAFPGENSSAFACGNATFPERKKLVQLARRAANVINKKSKTAKNHNHSGRSPDKSPDYWGAHS